MKSQDESDRMMGQANYLENNVVRTPFENEFDVKKEMPEFDLQSPQLVAIFEVYKTETLALHEKLSAEREKWQAQFQYQQFIDKCRQFRDPIEIDRQDDVEFTLVNVANVLNNYRKKNLTLTYPEFSVFLLWLAKICKIASWKEFYFSIGYTISEFMQYLKTNKAEKNQASWKAFHTDFGAKVEAEVPKILQDHVHIMDKGDLVSFLKLYFKWVMYFDLY